MPHDHRTRLLVMRHAKTEAYAGSDRVRRLTDRGVADARAAGRWLVEQELVPDVVLVSSAVRARETADHVVETMGQAPAVQVYDELYGADVDEVLELCALVPDGTRSVMVVGHNPTMAELVHAVQADPGEPWAAHLPTAGVAVIEFDESAEPARGAGHLTVTHVARG
jgi:phosphohistidine phosphatase